MFFAHAVIILACVAGGLVGARSNFLAAKPRKRAAQPRKRAAQPRESGAGRSELALHFTADYHYPSGFLLPDGHYRLTVSPADEHYHVTRWI